MTSRADELIAAVRRLADALDVTVPLELVRELADRCGWGTRDIRAPLLPSGVRHGVPWGVSTAITPEGTREVRVFVEAQATSGDSWTTALALTDWLASQGADLARFRALIDGPPHRLWHAVAFAPDSPPRWHAYLCAPHASAIAALRRVGVEMPAPNSSFSGASVHRQYIVRTPSVRVAKRGCIVAPTRAVRANDRITIASLDLTAAMRVKAYVLMPDTSLDELASLHDGAASAVRGDAQRFGRAMLGDGRRIWWLAALGFGSSGYESCALHFGVPRHVDEPTARERIRALLADYELDATAWERVASAHHFVTFQRRDGAPRVTTYFLPEVAR